MWETVPEEVGVGEDISWVRDELSNAVRAEDRKLLYVARVDGKMAGTSVIWVSRRDPKLAEFALPGTAPEFRRRGIGQALFDAPVADFRAMGGESIFLGASSYAFRTYMRAGYHKLVGTSALAYVASGESPEAYLVDFFRGLGPATVGPGEHADRTAAVPSGAHAARLAGDGRQRRPALAPVQSAQGVLRPVRAGSSTCSTRPSLRSSPHAPATAARSWGSPRQSSRTASARRLHASLLRGGTS